MSQTSELISNNHLADDLLPIDQSTEEAIPAVLSPEDLKMFLHVVTKVKNGSSNLQNAEQIHHDAQIGMERARGGFEAITEILVEKYRLNPDNGDRITEQGVIVRASATMPIISMPHTDH